jgi:Phosphopantetheine attachment site
MTPSSQAEAPIAAQAHVETTSSSEQYMAALWAEIIGLDEVARTDKFLEVGGNSLTLNVVLNRIKVEHGVSMEPQQFFDPDRSTVFELASTLNELLADPSREEADTPELGCR